MEDNKRDIQKQDGQKSAKNQVSLAFPDLIVSHKF